MGAAIIDNVSCEWTVDDALAEPPAQTELRRYIKAGKRLCPEGGRLTKVRVHVDCAQAQVDAQYSVKVHFAEKRQSPSPKKDAGYSLYDAVELARARQKRQFYNTWHTCETCGVLRKPTAKIRQQWLCFDCAERSRRSAQAQ